MTHELLRMYAYVGSNRTYQVVYSGRCQPGFEIKSLSECSAAAKFLDATGISASSGGLYGSNSHPPFCYYKNGQLKFNAGNNRGSCNRAYACACLKALPASGAPHHGENGMPVCIHDLACVSKDFKLR